MQSLRPDLQFLGRPVLPHETSQQTSNEVIVHPTVLLNTHPSKRLENSYNSYTSMVDLVHVSDNSPKDPET